MNKIKLIVKPEDTDFTYVALIDVEYETTYVSYYKEYAYKFESLKEEVLEFDSSNTDTADLISNVYRVLQKLADID